jgi:hypothetical protein
MEDLMFDNTKNDRDPLRDQAIALRDRVAAFRTAAVTAAEVVIAAYDAAQHAIVAVEKVRTAQQHAVAFFGDSSNGDDGYLLDFEDDKDGTDLRTRWFGRFCRAVLESQVLDDVNFTSQDLNEAAGHLGAGNMRACAENLDGLIGDLDRCIAPDPAEMKGMREEARRRLGGRAGSVAGKTRAEQLRALAAARRLDRGAETKDG